MFRYFPQWGARLYPCSRAQHLLGVSWPGSMYTSPPCVVPRMYMRLPISRPHKSSQLLAALSLSLPGLQAVVIRAISKLPAASYLHKAAVAILSFPVVRPLGSSSDQETADRILIRAPPRTPPVPALATLYITTASCSPSPGGLNPTASSTAVATQHQHQGSPPQSHMTMPAQRPSQLPPCPGPPPSRPLPPLPKRG